MKRTRLMVKKWALGGVSLFALYVALQPDGILMRLGMLVVAGSSGALWAKYKRELELFVPDAVESVDTDLVLPVQAEDAWYFVKMPVRYPRPVYVHREEFHLYPH